MTIGIQVTLSKGSHPFAKVTFLEQNAFLNNIERMDSEFQFTWIMPKKAFPPRTHERKVPAQRSSLRMPTNAPAERKFNAPQHFETWLTCEAVCNDDHLLPA